MARGRDGLHRRERGIFAFSYKDAKGRWREKYCGTTDRQEAKDFKDKFETDLKKGFSPTGEKAKWTLEEAEKWWISYREQLISPATLSSERYRLQHLRTFLKNKRLKEISNDDLKEYASQRLKDGVGPHSINKEILLWSLVLKEAKLWARLREDYKPLKTTASDIGKAITREQLKKLAMVAQTATSWEVCFYGSVLAVSTGMRGGEVKKLRVGSVDVEARRLVIRRAGAKTDSSARIVELNRDGLEAVKRLIVRAKSLGASEPEHFLLPRHCSRVKHGPEKGALGYDVNRPQIAWDSAWASLTKKAGLPGFRFHDLRHTFVTHLVERGIPLAVVQSMVGHISARMTRHYLHVSSGVARRAVEILDSEPLLEQILSQTNPQEAEAAQQKPITRMIQ